MATGFSRDVEDAFPAGLWTVTDYNGPGVGDPPVAGGSVIWDDTPTKPFRGGWSGRPNDDSTYANLTDTWMKYGPINLLDATDADLGFWYWMNTRPTMTNSLSNIAALGLFGLEHLSRGHQMVGLEQLFPMTRCVGRSTVFFRFGFKSDFVITGPGVWVDDIKLFAYK